MIDYKQTKILPFKAEFIYDIIRDIEKYPEFVPWCDAAKIISQDAGKVIAELQIGYSLFTQKYCSSVTSNIDQDTYSVEVLGISGPFEHLANHWNVKALAEGCEVSLNLIVKFKSFLGQSLIESFFNKFAEKIVQAFVDRAYLLAQK